MKMTLVIDTDDRDGIDDAFKMISVMKQRHVGAAAIPGAHTLTISKIPLIKALRAFVREQTTTRTGEDVESLRDAKLFAERLIANDGRL